MKQLVADPVRNGDDECEHDADEHYEDDIIRSPHR